MAQIVVYSNSTSYGRTMRRYTLPSYENFATIRAGEGFDNQTTPWVYIAKAADGYYEIDRRGLIFPTSGILPYTAKITSASISVFLTVKKNDVTGAGAINIVDPNPATPGSWATSDYQRFLTTKFATDLPIASMPAVNNWITFSLNSYGIAAINRAGLSLFGFRVVDDIDGSISPISVGWDGIEFRHNQETYPSHVPYLTIDYEYPMKVNINDTWRDVVEANVNINDTWKNLSNLQVNINDVWKTVF